MRIVKGLVGLILFFGILYLGIQFAQDNNEMISLKLPGGWETLGVELWALVVMSAAAGAAVATLIFLVQLVVSEFGKRKLARRIKVLERELNDLRNMPLAPERTPEIADVSKPAGDAAEGSAVTAGQPGDASSV